MAGWYPWPGTLNVRPLRPSLAEVVALLPPPLRETEAASAIGPLRWWAGYLETPRRGVFPIFLVRGMKTTTRYLELVAPNQLRSVGKLSDGALVRCILRGPSS